MTPHNEHEELVKHLEFIQTIIARQAANSFLLKGWSLTLVAGLFALAAKDADARFVWLAFVPVLGFGALDAYYLNQERRFRRLFNWVRRGRRGLNDERRDEIGPFCLDPDCVPASERSGDERHALLSPSLWAFYGMLLVAVAFIFALVR